MWIKIDSSHTDSPRSTHLPSGNPITEFWKIMGGEQLKSMTLRTNDGSEVTYTLEEL